MYHFWYQRNTASAARPPTAHARAAAMAAAARAEGGTNYQLTPHQKDTSRAPPPWLPPRARRGEQLPTDSAPKRHLARTGTQLSAFEVTLRERHTI